MAFDSSSHGGRCERPALLEGEAADREVRPARAQGAHQARVPLLGHRVVGVQEREVGAAGLLDAAVARGADPLGLLHHEPDVPVTGRQRPGDHEGRGVGTVGHQDHLDAGPRLEQGALDRPLQRRRGIAEGHDHAEPRQPGTTHPALERREPGAHRTQARPRPSYGTRAQDPVHGGAHVDVTPNGAVLGLVRPCRSLERRLPPVRTLVGRADSASDR